MPTPHLHTLADLATRVIAVATVAGLAGLAGWISYHHMLLLAQRHNERGIDAHAFPICVDGLDLIGVLVLLADRRARRASGALPWTVLGVGTLASIAANVAVAPNDIIARAISGWSAVALLAAAKMLAHLFEPATSTHEPRAPQQPQDGAAALPDGATPTPAADTPPPGGNTAAGRGHQRRRIRSDVARRVPATPDAYARWCAIWDATRHLPAATRDAAHTYGVALRTLQFIRAAGEAGLLIPPPTHATIDRQPVHTEPSASTDHGEPERTTELTDVEA